MLEKITLEAEDCKICRCYQIKARKFRTVVQCLYTFFVVLGAVTDPPGGGVLTYMGYR